MGVGHPWGDVVPFFAVLQSGMEPWLLVTIGEQAVTEGLFSNPNWQK
jgi:hypothetical protein